MTIKLYDLCGDDRAVRFSPACWRTRMALEHKGLDYETIPVRFTEIAGICGGGHKTVPVIDDAGAVVRDSWAIANYLEETYPSAPSLFGGEGGQALSQFMHWWSNATLDTQIARLVLVDIHDSLGAEDQAYFRPSREARFKAGLEEVMDRSEAKVEAFRNSLMPLRLTVRKQDFIGGEQPHYADYCVFGSFQWARMVSDFALLEPEDPVSSWFERCLDLFDGLGRKAKG